MIKRILNEGQKSGFYATEVYRKKIDKCVYVQEDTCHTQHQIDTDRLIVRAFRETGAPVGFTISTPDLKRIRDAFHNMYDAFVPDQKASFAQSLPKQIDKVELNIYDSQYSRIDQTTYAELLERLYEAQVSAFPALNIDRIGFSKMLKKIYLTNSIMYANNELKVKYRKTEFQLHLTFTHKDNRIEIIDNKPFFSMLNPDKLVARAYNLLNSLTASQQVNLSVKHLILSPEAAATILREFSDHFRLNSEKRIKNITFPQALSIIDNPRLDRQSSSVPFDDEGIQAVETVLIEKGFLKNTISNIETALSSGMQSTGNGFRSQKTIFPEIKFTNLYIKPSVFPFSKLMSDGDRGILISLVKVKRIEGAVYTFSAYGYQFSNGTINEPVHIYLKTTFENFFLSVLKVSKEIRFFYNQSNVGAPYLLIEPGKKSGNLFEL